MKITDVVLNETVEKRDRNIQISIHCPLVLSPDIILSCTREVILVKDGKRIDTGGENGERAYMVEKKLSEIASIPVTIGGVTLTIAQIAAFVEAATDLFAETEGESSASA